jgi:hypothetical protein
MQRYDINKKNNFRSLIPMMTLLLDMLNYDMINLDWKTFTLASKILLEEINKSIKDFFDFKNFLNTQIFIKVKIMKELEVKKNKRIYNKILIKE